MIIKILNIIKRINKVLDHFMILIYLFMRVLIVGIIAIILSDKAIEINWILHIGMILYIIYPVYNHFFNQIYWSSYFQEQLNKRSKK